MILYAVKIGEFYLHDEKDGHFSKVSIKRASVYDDLEKAKQISGNQSGSRVVILTLTESELTDKMV